MFLTMVYTIQCAEVWHALQKKMTDSSDKVPRTASTSESDDKNRVDRSDGVNRDPEKEFFDRGKLPRVKVLQGCPE